jgi:hypothetical protein
MAICIHRVETCHITYQANDHPVVFPLLHQYRIYFQYFYDIVGINALSSMFHYCFCSCLYDEFPWPLISYMTPICRQIVLLSFSLFLYTRHVFLLITLRIYTITFHLQSIKTLLDIIRH